MKKSLLTIFFLALSCYSVWAKANESDFFRSIGKIYVVVAVIVAIFIGIIAFLIYLDRKLTKLENQINHNE